MKKKQKHLHNQETKQNCGTLGGYFPSLLSVYGGNPPPTNTIEKQTIAWCVKRLEVGMSAPLVTKPPCPRTRTRPRGCACIGHHGVVGRWCLWLCWSPPRLLLIASSITSSLLLNLLAPPTPHHTPHSPQVHARPWATFPARTTAGRCGMAGRAALWTGAKPPSLLRPSSIIAASREGGPAGGMEAEEAGAAAAVQD